MRIRQNVEAVKLGLTVHKKNSVGCLVFTSIYVTSWPSAPGLMRDGIDVFEVWTHVLFPS